MLQQLFTHLQTNTNCISLALLIKCCTNECRLKYIFLSLCQLLYWHIPTQCRGSGDAMATSIYGSAKFHYSVFMGYFVGRQSLSSTSMQFAIASQFVMADPPFTRPPTYPHTYILTSGAKSPVPMGLSSADGDHCCEPVLSEVLCCLIEDLLYQAIRDSATYQGFTGGPL